MLNGIPLHPLVVHAPIGLLLFATLLLLCSLQWTRIKLFALITLVVGLLSGIVAYITGDGAEEFGIDKWNLERADIHQHENFALYSLITFGISLLFLLLSYRSKGKVWLAVSLIVALIGSGLLAYAGHLGGQMVYTR
ncbi:DUF2231 domain-containing protein [uncultured Exiguobacterium sp.]|uniref:DUF2231 domain-containing protein n=1 Tax=uncultured Exiguobacterium sp. TaxID=202669 RepID=UPI0025D85F0B|nr:DUF2231 domain-containing protein [uncultured Exiguobacterium sp.]